MKREFITPVGVDLIAVALPMGHIMGIEIDNPSGSWLRVSGIEQFVPPFTEAWAYPVSPAASSLDVRFTDAPSGSVSELIGSPPTIRLFSESIAVSPGRPVGSLGRMAQAGVTRTFTAPYQVHEASSVTGNEYLPGLALASHKLAPTKITIAATPSDPTRSYLRGLLVLELLTAGNLTVFGILGISPENPMASLDYLPGALDATFDENEDIDLFFITSDMMGDNTVRVVIQYHYVRVAP